MWKRPANRNEFNLCTFELLKLCDKKLGLNYLHSTAQQTNHYPHIFLDDLCLLECIFYSNRPMVSLVYILEFSSTMFEKTTVGRRAFWVIIKKCNGFTSQVIWFTSRGKKIIPSFRIHCIVKLECANSIYFKLNYTLLLLLFKLCMNSLCRLEV